MKRRIELWTVAVLVVGILAGCVSGRTAKPAGHENSTLPSTAPTVSSTKPPLASSTISSNPVTHLTADSTPRTGSAGTTTIDASATLTDVPTGLTGSIEFDIHLGTGTQGQPAFSVATPFHGPGTYPMPNGFVPTTPGDYYVQVMTVNTSDASSYQVAPFVNPDLTTIISG